VRWTAVAVAVTVACDHGGRATPTSTATATATPTATATATPTTTSTPTSTSTFRGKACGEVDCWQYDSARDAFLDAVSGDPRVLAIGEAHAPKGATASSAAKRFTTDLLPVLEGRASDLLLELMMPPTGCADAAAEVKEKQQFVTSRQSENNQNEYVIMGERARAVGVVPDMLRPTCADLDGIRGAGQDAIGASLDFIARATRAQAKRLVDRDARSDADRGKAVIIYGGMLHNDLAPSPDAARWSYAPDLDAYVDGRFVAIDLVVPEFIVDDETWRSLPFWHRYDRARFGAKTTLFRTAARSFVLVFPSSNAGRDGANRQDAGNAK
jgi:hypothetical protein